MIAWRPGFTNQRSLLTQSLVASFLPVVASAATVLVVVAILLFGQKASFERETAFRATSVAKLVAQQAELGVVTEDKVELDRITRNTLRIDDVIYVVIVSPSGAVLSAANIPGFTQSTSHRTFINAAAPIMPSETRTLVEWETPKERIVSLATVRIGVSTEAQSARLRQSLAIVLLVSFSGLFGLGLILTFQQRHMRKVLAPLKELIRFAQVLAAGDLTQRTVVVRDDEVLPTRDLHQPEADLEGQVPAELGCDNLALGYPPHRPGPVVTQELRSLGSRGGIATPGDPLALG
jgi:hypothetical protein